MSDPVPAVIEQWNLLAASVRGASHETCNHPCQDSHASTLLPGGFLVAAVADGAGSAACAELGSATAAAAAVEAVTAAQDQLAGLSDQAAWKPFFQSVIQSARGGVEKAALEADRPLADFATTLIVVVFGPDMAAAAQVGDGAAVVADAAGAIYSLTVPQVSEYLNETTFLTSPNLMEALQCTFWKGCPSQGAVMSDGLQMLALKMPGASPHAPFFLPLFRFAAGVTDALAAQAQLAGWLASDAVRKRSDDDVTLMLITRKACPAPPAPDSHE